MDLDFSEQKRQVNNLYGARDVAIFFLSISISLDIDDFLKMQVLNNNGNGNVTLELSSFYQISGK